MIFVIKESHVLVLYMIFLIKGSLGEAAVAAQGAPGRRLWRRLGLGSSSIVSYMV